LRVPRDRSGGRERRLHREITRAKSRNGKMIAELVSVVTPCYNAAAHIEETIQSVRAQTYAPVEHIVVDDASTDRSREVVGGFSHVRAVSLEHNRGGSHARNVGASLAQGEFLMFLDADDVLVPDTLMALVSAVRRRRATIGVSPWRRLQSDARGQWALAPADVPLPTPGADHVKEWLDGTCWVPPCAVLWHRADYMQTGGWDEALSLDDDADLMMRALLDGFTPAVATHGVAFYRDHGKPGSSVSTDLFSARRIASRVRVVDKLAMRLTERGRLLEYAVSLGAAYQRAARDAYQQGLVDIGRACEATGEALAGAQTVSHGRIGQAARRVLGLERKERIAQALARWGIGRRWRREIARVGAKRPRNSDIVRDR
jgi:glycosyltransferase involved in cell wall biosynthesis